MTEVELKALALVNEATSGDEPWTLDDVRGGVVFSALCRAIEQHEAFKQEVSDTISELSSEYTSMGSYYADKLRRFIIAKPDPLVEVIDDMNANPQPYVDSEHYSKRLRAAIEKRGGKIVWECLK